MAMQRRWLAVASVALITLIVAVPRVAAKEPRDHGGKGWLLPKHSFERTLTYDNGLDHWLSSAGTMALRDRVQLMPPVGGRHGLFWHKKAALTRDFELQFTIGTRDDGSKVSDGTIAVWISPDNFTASYNEQAIVQTVKDWTVGQTNAGLTLLGNRPTFKGFVLLLMSSDKDKGPRQSVAAVVNDGSRSVSLDALANEAKNGAQFANYAWQGPSTQVKVRVNPDGSIKVALMAEGKPWTDVVTLPRGTFVSSQSENYLGFSGYTGTPPGYIEVDLSRVEFRNFDSTTAGEDESDVLGEDTEDWKNFLEQEGKYVSQASQKEAVERLHKLLQDHVDRCETGGQEIKTSLLVMDERLDKLGFDVSKTLAEAQAWVFEKQAFDPEMVKHHIVGIRSMISKDKDAHDTKLSQVHKVAQELKAQGSPVMGAEAKQKVQKVADQAIELELFTERGSYQTNTLLIVIVVAVVALGFLFLNRMRYYEKKNYI